MSSPPRRVVQLAHVPEVTALPTCATKDAIGAADMSRHAAAASHARFAVYFTSAIYARSLLPSAYASLHTRTSSYDIEAIPVILYSRDMIISPPRRVDAHYALVSFITPHGHQRHAIAPARLPCQATMRAHATSECTPFIVDALVSSSNTNIMAFLGAARQSHVSKNARAGHARS